MKTEKQIIYDDENAARFVENIKGWVDVNNRFYGNNPDLLTAGYKTSSGIDSNNLSN